MFRFMKYLGSCGILWLGLLAAILPSSVRAQPGGSAPQDSLLVQGALGLYDDARFEDAIRQLEPALDSQAISQPFLGQAHELLARCYIRIGRPEMARRHVQLLLAQDPAYHPDEQLVPPSESAGIKLIIDSLEKEPSRPLIPPPAEPKERSEGSSKVNSPILWVGLTGSWTRYRVSDIDAYNRIVDEPKSFFNSTATPISHHGENSALGSGVRLSVRLGEVWKFGARYETLGRREGSLAYLDSLGYRVDSAIYTEGRSYALSAQYQVYRAGPVALAVRVDAGTLKQTFQEHGYYARLATYTYPYTSGEWKLSSLLLDPCIVASHTFAKRFALQTSLGYRWHDAKPSFPLFHNQSIPVDQSGVRVGVEALVGLL